MVCHETRYLLQSILWSNLIRNKKLVILLQGGMSNELYNSIARVTDGIYEGMTVQAC